MTIENDISKHWGIPECSRCESRNIQITAYLQFEEGEPFRLNDVAEGEFGYCCNGECETYSQPTQINWVKE